MFFDNTDVKLRAPVDARRMAKELGVGPGETVSRVFADLGVKAKAMKTRQSPVTSRVVCRRGAIDPLSAGGSLELAVCIRRVVMCSAPRPSRASGTSSAKDTLA